MSNVSERSSVVDPGKMLEGPHVVQTVGQFDKDHTDVVHHGQHHFAEIFGLLLLTSMEINLAYLGDALDNVRHLLAKFFAMSTTVTDVSSTESWRRPAAIDTGSIFISARTSATSRDVQIGFAGGAALSGMMLLGELIGFANKLQIFGGPIGLHSAQQLTELGHREHVGRDLLAQCRHDRL